MILLADNQTLNIVLTAAVATTEADLYASYVDLANAELTAPSPVTLVTNGTTPVVLVASPATGGIRQVKYLSCYNKDTAPIEVTVSFDDDGDVRTLLVVTLNEGERIEYVDSDGFKLPKSASVQDLIDAWFATVTLANIPAATDEADALIKFNSLLSDLKTQGYMTPD